MVVTKRVRRAVIAVLTVGLAVTPVAPAAANTTIAAAPVCTSELHPEYATYLSGAVLAAANGVTVGLYDRRTDTLCFTDPLREFKSASIVKVAVAVALQLRAQQNSRPLDDRERALVEPMIISSDNDATSTLWRELHINGPYLEQALVGAGMAYTRPGSDGEFGSTITTAQDQISLLMFLTSPTENALEPSRREYILDLMSRVVPQQRYGVPVGAPLGTTWHNKIGYGRLGDSYGNYRTHSIGAIRGTGINGEHDYVMALLSDGNLPLVGIARVSSSAFNLNLAMQVIPD